MKKKILKLDVDAWFANRLLRLCTPAARGFLVDLRMLCVPSGYLHSNDMPLSEDQIASLTGTTAAKVRDWMKELAAAAAYEVDEAKDMLFFPDMVKDAAFKEQAKVSGSKGASKKLVCMAGAAILKREAEVAAGSSKPAEVPARPARPLGPVIPAGPAKKLAPWWKTPAGWVKKGNEQAVSQLPDEAFEDFQVRVAKRLGEGEHLDVLSPRTAKAIREEIKRGAEAIKAAFPQP